MNYHFEAHFLNVLSRYLPDKGLMGTAVNRTLSSMLGESLEITLTVPLTLPS